MFHSVVPGESCFGIGKHVVKLLGFCILNQTPATVVHFTRRDRLVVYNGLRVDTLNTVSIGLLLLEVPVQKVLADDAEELVNDLCLFLLLITTIFHLTLLI